MMHVETATGIQPLTKSNLVLPSTTSVTDIHIIYQTSIICQQTSDLILIS